MKIAGTFTGFFGANDKKKRNNTQLDRSVVKDFEIEDFAGVWYQVAHIENPRKHSLSHINMTFTVDTEGRIGMRTEGYNCEKGVFEISTSRVIAPDEERQASMRLPGLPLTDRDRELNVLEVDADYNFALVTGRSADRMWILSRAPYIPNEDLGYLLARALERGYDISDLVFTDHRPVIAPGKETLVAAV